jgi:type I restriction enzyme S subunit
MSTRAEWPVVCIKDVCESVIDCVNKTAPTVNYPTPYKMIRTSNVKDGWINLDEVRFVEAEVYARWNRRAIPRQGDVILTREAPLGEVGMVRCSDHVFLGQRLVLYRADPLKLDNRFLLYSFRCDYLQGQIKSLGSGATVEHMRVPDAEKLLLRLPPLPIQTRIGDVLSAYDDLIENNTRRITLLEQMAEMIYREWFVDLRFPGHEKAKIVESSDIGSIPEGWKTATFAEIANFLNGYAFGPEDWGTTGKPIIKIKELKNGVGNDTPRYSGNDLDSKYRVSSGDVLFSWSASLDVYIWAGEEGLLNQHLFRVTSKSRFGRTLLFHSLKHRMEDFRLRSMGTTMRHIKRGALNEVHTIVPESSIRAQFEALVEPMADLATNLRLKNITLRQTRDLLLSKLISGEVCVEQAEAEAAAQTV